MERHLVTAAYEVIDLIIAFINSMKVSVPWRLLKLILRSFFTTQCMGRWLSDWSDLGPHL